MSDEDRMDEPHYCADCKFEGTWMDFEGVILGDDKCPNCGSHMICNVPETKQGTPPAPNP
jgi:predicted RNA-binding Zn-ribbon protein involved in translation (DUF1610 family)